MWIDVRIYSPNDNLMVERRIMCVDVRTNDGKQGVRAELWDDIMDCLKAVYDGKEQKE